jgi:uncharacterized protein (TIGR03643 family)
MTLVSNSDGYVSEVIQLAWADDVSFEEIKERLGLSEPEVIDVMRRHMKPSSFRMWRKRVSGRKTKHRKLLRMASDDPLMALEHSEEEV